VRYADTDHMGVVYHANYFIYFETGRAEMMRKLWKPYSQLEKEGWILPVIEAGCRYHRGAQYDDLLTICTRAAITSGVRLRFDYTLYRNGESAPLAEGYTVHCFTDLEGKPRRLPKELIQALEVHNVGMKNDV
jgi:acyl-CoA thioester hydrolase